MGGAPERSRTVPQKRSRGSVIFVDTNVFVYAVGRDHSLKAPARAFFPQAAQAGDVLATSSEVIQELLHIYLPVARFATLDAALELVRGTMVEVWNLEPEDVYLARSFADHHPHLVARDLVHLACCRRRKVTRVKTFDRGLAAAFKKRAQ